MIHVKACREVSHGHLSRSVSCWMLVELICSISETFLFGSLVPCLKSKNGDVFINRKF